MHHIHTTPGFIIQARPYGEAGKMLFIFTREFGLIMAAAQGIRLERSKLRYYTQEHAMGMFSLVKGREMWRLTSAAPFSLRTFPLRATQSGKVHPRSGGEMAISQSLIARLAQLLRRLLQGEEAHPEVFDVIKACVDFVGDENISEDSESLAILKTIKDLHKIVPQGAEDNFWSLGTENSPGGPTVEFYIDNVEIWNLVFNEYIYQNGKYVPSQLKGVDTGMGFERLLASLNNFDNVYETDLLSPIISKIKEVAGSFHPFHEKDFRIIADHLKAALFLLNEGVLPANKDQGYIVRRLIRRAIIKLNGLGVRENVLKEIAQTVFTIYTGVYDFSIYTVLPELEKEEVRFRVTLASGLKLLQSKKVLTGQDLFDLYQSYGLPLEVSLEEAKNHHINIEENALDSYNELFKSHQELSRTASAGMFKGGLVGQSEQTTKYHTATHLLLAALRQVLGDGIHQKGANITDERIRFDFSYAEKMTPEQIQQVEDLVNEKIKADLQVSMQEMRLEDAQNCGAMGDFATKYGETVKVYSIGNYSTTEPPFSREICGGPHITNTGILGHFKIIKEESSSAGVRRIKAILE